MKKNKKLALLILLGFIGVGGLIAGITTMSIYLSKSNKSQDQKSISEIAKALKIKFKEENNQTQKDIQASDVTEQQILLEYSNQILAFNPKAKVLNQYEISLKANNGKKVFADDVSGKVEVILIVQDLKDTKNKTEIVKTLSGFKTIDKTALDKGVTITEKGKVDYAKIHQELTALAVASPERTKVIEKYFNVNLSDPASYLTDITANHQNGKLTIELKLNKDYKITDATGEKTNKQTGATQTFNFGEEKLQGDQPDPEADLAKKQAAIKLNLQQELDKIASLVIKSGSDFADTLPSTVDTNNLNKTNLDSKISASASYEVLSGYDMTYTFPKDKMANDDEGTLNISVNLTKEGITLGKDFKVIGFANKVSKLAKSPLTLELIDAIDKTTVLPSSLLDAKGEADNTKFKLTSKIIDMSLYTYTITKKWVNDVEGRASFDAITTLKSDTSITKKFPDFMILDMKKETVTNTLAATDFKFITGKESTTTKEFVTAVAGAEGVVAKTAKVQEYFNVTIPKDHTLEIISTQEKPSAATTTIINYQLVKSNIIAGNDANPSTTSSVKSSVLSVEVDGFRNSGIESGEINKIASIAVKAGSALATTLVSDITDAQLTSENIEPKLADGSTYTPPAGFVLKYSIPTTDNKDVFVGSMDVEIKIMDATTNVLSPGQQKTLKLSKLKTKLDAIDESKIQISAKNPSSNYASTFLESSKAKFENSKINLTIPDFTTEELGNYTLEYKKVWVNDVTGKAKLTFKISATSDPTVFKEFSRQFELTGFKIYKVEDLKDQVTASVKEDQKGVIAYRTIQNKMDSVSGHQAKFDILKEYLNVSIPSGTILKDITFTAISDEKTSAKMAFYLMNSNIPTGTDSDPKATTEQTSLYLFRNITNFAYDFPLNGGAK